MQWCPGLPDLDLSATTHTSANAEYRDYASKAAHLNF